jgi:hypothetical protein
VGREQREAAFFTSLEILQKRCRGRTEKEKALEIVLEF